MPDRPVSMMSEMSAHTQVPRKLVVLGDGACGKVGQAQGAHADARPRC
jgi:hypothetical protein